MHVSRITVIRHSKLRMGCNYNGLFCFNNTYNEVLLYSNFLHGWLDECNHRPGVLRPPTRFGRPPPRDQRAKL